MIHYIRKYAAAVEAEAEKTADSVRKEELLEMARIMKKVSTEKPDTFVDLKALRAKIMELCDHTPLDF